MWTLSVTCQCHLFHDLFRVALAYTVIVASTQRIRYTVDFEVQVKQQF